MRIDSNYQINYPFNLNIQSLKITPEESTASVSNDSGLDTVSFSAYQCEHFEDVYNEMLQYVPDQTTTIPEKQLALTYIDRMLACNDITHELATYWENKRVIIENEIQNIINEQNIGQDTDFESLETEFWEFSNRVWNRPVEFNNVPDRVEYWLSYYNTCLSYIDRLLSCEGITDEKRAEYEQLKNNMLFDANNQKRDLNRYNSENGIATESFDDVYNEMMRNVPDQTTTISQKQLAISYIDRMLSCDDIGTMQRAFWEHQRIVIQNEIDHFNE